MKKFILLFVFMIIFSISAFADTMPFYIDSIPKSALGLYQTDNEIALYSSPDEKSALIKKMNFSYNPETMPDRVFAKASFGK